MVLIEHAAHAASRQSDKHCSFVAGSGWLIELQECGRIWARFECAMYLPQNTHCIVTLTKHVQQVTEHRAHFSGDNSVAFRNSLTSSILQANQRAMIDLCSAMLHDRHQDDHVGKEAKRQMVAVAQNPKRRPRRPRKATTSNCRSGYRKRHRNHDPFQDVSGRSPGDGIAGCEESASRFGGRSGASQCAIPTGYLAGRAAVPEMQARARRAGVGGEAGLTARPCVGMAVGRRSLGWRVHFLSHSRPRRLLFEG